MTVYFQKTDLIGPGIDRLRFKPADGWDIQIQALRGKLENPHAFGDQRIHIGAGVVARIIYWTQAIEIAPETFFDELLNWPENKIEALAQDGG